MRTVARLFLVNALALVPMGAARADLVITTESKDVTVDPPTTESHMMYLSADKLATSAERGGTQYTTIFRGDKQAIWNIDPSTKTYMEIDKAAMKEMGDQMSEALKQMKGKLAEMPPDQRAMVEKMMAQSAGGEAGPKLEVEPGGEKKTIEGKACERWDILLEGKRTNAIWVAKWGEAHVEKNDFAALRSMAAFLEDAMRSNPMLQRMGGNMARGMDQVDGFPVLIQRYDGEKLVEETTFKKAEKKPIEASMFEIPAGYSRREMGPPKR